MHPAQLYGGFRTIIFLVCGPLENVILRESGSTWGDDFYMGMQNGSELEI